MNEKMIDKIDKFLRIYANIQIWVFVISMVTVAVIYILNPAAHYYEVVSPEQEGVQLWLENFNVTNITVDGVVEFESISTVRAAEMKKKFDRLFWIAIVSMLGWFVFIPEKREGIRLLFSKIKRVNVD